MTKNGKGTVTETNDNNEVKATKLMEFIDASDAKKAKKGITIRFMHDLGQGTVYWLEGEVEESVWSQDLDNFWSQDLELVELI